MTDNQETIGENPHMPEKPQEINPGEALRTTPNKEARSEDDNVVFIGNKHLMNYVNSIQIQLKKNDSGVIIKARGKFISKAVDVVEVAKRQINEQQMSIKDIQLGTEEYENEGKKVKVSTIDISLNK